MRKCVYCGSDLHDDRSMEICDRCGEKVWGKKMFDAIKKTTNDARDKGNLELYKSEVIEGTNKKF